MTISPASRGGHVQISCNNDLTLLLSSGSQVASSNRRSTPLEQPQSLAAQEWEQRATGGERQSGQEHEPVRGPDQRAHRGLE